MSSNPTTPSGSTSASLTINLETIRTAHSKFPPGLRLTQKDYQILLHVEHYREQPYDQWPDELKMRKAVEKLRRRSYIRRSYWPTKYTITRRGFGLVQWIKSLLEHVDANPAAQT